jgi:ornithine carbamoyltransferase
MDFSPEEIRYLLDLAENLKEKKRSGASNYLLRGKNIVLLFEKTSTRTRCAFEVAALDEGAHVTYLDSGSSQVGKKESLEDTAKVLGRFYDGIEYRGYEQKIVEDLAEFSGVPVWNGLTDVDHPTQILADMLTIEEHVAKPLNKVKVVFAGDIRNNMSYAWMYGCAKMGMHYVAFGPKELADQLDEETIKKVYEIAAYTGAKIEISDNIDCVKGADVIYTDIWASMGEEAQIPERVKLLTPYRVDMNLLKATENEDIKFMHCLPSFHDFETRMAKEQMELDYDIREVTDEVFKSRYSIVFDEAENRLHTIKAVIVATIG